MIILNLIYNIFILPDIIVIIYIIQMHWFYMTTNIIYKFNI
jgi:hypothetical protein